MKRKIIGLLVIVALFAFAIAAYAYSTGGTTTTAASCCCKKDGDSCPMKSKGGHDSAKGEHGKASCCAKHASDDATAEGKHNCCGDSCPMKKGETATAGSATDGKSCCDGCDCCKGKSETPA